MPNKYLIVTYGCQMNVHESEKIAGILVSKGYEETMNEDDADIIVLNTCCIRETAEMKVLGNLGHFKKIKEKNSDLIIVVCGCMSQKEGAAEMLKKRCPFINLILGTHNLHMLGVYLEKLSNKKPYAEIWKTEKQIEENIPTYRTSGVNAWVNIMFGCNNFCSYCIVPYVRGRERSRSEFAILEDVKKLVNEGYKEITLLGQNVNSYGNDLDDKEINFSSLLKKIDRINGEFWVRFMTSHPKDISEDVIKTIAQSNKIEHHIHLPVQAGNDRILELMNRKYTSSQYLDKLKMIRSYIPDATISSDIMVGFPTETENEFQDTLQLVINAQFSNTYSFVYSRRSGTVADKMENQISAAIKQDRIKRLIATQAEQAKNRISLEIGKELIVLCDKVKDGKGYGKTLSDRSVSFKSDGGHYGKFVKVKILRFKNNKLEGELISFP